MKIHTTVVRKNGHRRKIDKGMQKADLTKDNRGKQSRWASWLEWVSNR